MKLDSVTGTKGLDKIKLNTFMKLNMFNVT